MPARAAGLEDAFKGKQVTIVIGFGMGGTYGLYAQLLARHMASHIPGKPTIIVQSMPGAGGIKASNYAYNVMQKDGLNWLMPPDSIVISNLLEKAKVKYQSDRFLYLGGAAQSNAVIAIRADKGVKTIDAAKNTEVIIGSTGTGSQTFLIPSMANAIFGTRFKIVMGYKASQDVYQAMERKEVDGTSLTWNGWLSSKRPWVESGYVVPLLQVGLDKDPDLPNVPMAVEMATSPEDRQIATFMSSLGPIGRSLILPPGVATDRVSGLRDAFDRTMADPAFVGEAKQRRLDLNPIKGLELQSIVSKMMKTPDAVVERAKSRIMAKGAAKR